MDQWSASVLEQIASRTGVCAVYERVGQMDDRVPMACSYPVALRYGRHGRRSQSIITYWDMMSSDSRPLRRDIQGWTHGPDQWTQNIQRGSTLRQWRSIVEKQATVAVPCRVERACVWLGKQLDGCLTGICVLQPTACNATLRF